MCNCGYFFLATSIIAMCYPWTCSAGSVPDHCFGFAYVYHGETSVGWHLSIADTVQPTELRTANAWYGGGHCTWLNKKRWWRHVTGQEYLSWSFRTCGLYNNDMVSIRSQLVFRSGGLLYFISVDHVERYGSCRCNKIAVFPCVNTQYRYLFGKNRIKKYSCRYVRHSAINCTI